MSYGLRSVADGTYYQTIVRSKVLSDNSWKRSLTLAYKRETYRLWFEFLRLAQLSRDTKVREALERNELFYRAWGDVRTIKFDTWWKSHSQLFEEKLVIRKLEPGSVTSSSTDVLTVEIPLTQSSSDIV
jgi:hypothetical protein